MDLTGRWFEEYTLARDAFETFIFLEDGSGVYLRTSLGRRRHLQKEIAISDVVWNVEDGIISVTDLDSCECILTGKAVLKENTDVTDISWDFTTLDHLHVEGGVPHNLREYSDFYRVTTECTLTDRLTELRRLCDLAEKRGYALDDKYSWKGFYIAEKDDKNGIVNSNGEIIIPFKYSYLSDLDEDGVCMASTNGWETDYFIMIGEDGTVFSPDQFILWDYFDKESGLQRAQIRFDKCGIVNRKGEIVIPFEYKYIFDIKDGCVVAEKNNKFGIIDMANNVLVPFVYNSLNQYDNGIFVAKKRKYYGLINKNGEIIAPFKFNEIYEFRNGLAVVQKGEKWGIIDENGNNIIPFKYDDIWSFYDRDKARATKDGKYGWIDKKGDTVIPFEYEPISGFLNDLCLARKNGKLGYISFDGVEVVPFIYDNILLDEDDDNMFYNGIINTGYQKRAFKDGDGNLIEFDFKEHWMN